MTDIPVIDLSKARNGNINERKALAQDICNACTEIGFITVKGHGIDQSIFDNVYKALDAFMALPLAQKEQCVTDVQPCYFQHNGFSPWLGESANALMGKPELPADYVEKYSVGRSILDDDFDLPFPSDPSCDGFRASLKRYYQACTELTELLTGLFALALDLPEDYFVDKIDDSWDYLRLHEFPTRSVNKDSDQGVAEHADISFLTILHNLQDGLEVQTRDGQWIEAKTDAPDQCIVNVGDFLQRWTNDEWCSTVHRVTLTGQKRQSAIFFKYVNDKTVLKTFPKYLKDGKSRYDDVIFDDHMLELTQKLFGE